MILKYIVNDNKYENIKQILKEEFQMSDRLIIKLKQYNFIFLNNSPTFINTQVKIGDLLECSLEWTEENDNIVPTKMDLSILYEDESMLIVNKPPFMTIHPSCRHFSTSLSNGIRFYFDEIGLKKKIRTVNRLDKDTSGLVIFAKNEYIQECLIKQMKNKIFQKKYLAIVEGTLDRKNGTINAPIARKENSIIERCVSQNGDMAITHFQVVQEFKNYSLISLLLETGRTHQIRVHSKYIGHPIIGDTLYGFSSPLISRQALHAYEVSFTHPVTKQNLTFTSNLPEDMKKLLNG